MSELKKHIAAAATMASAAYPNWNPTSATLQVWAGLLPELSGPELVEAMAAHIRASKFPPTVADILDRSKLMRSGPEADAPGLLAWGEVHKAIREGVRPAWSSHLIAPALDVLGGWGRVCGCQTSEVASLRSRFVQAFESLQKSELLDVERDTVQQIAGSGNLRLLGTDKTDPALE